MTYRVPLLSTEEIRQSRTFENLIKYPHVDWCELSTYLKLGNSNRPFLTKKEVKAKTSILEQMVTPDDAKNTVLKHLNSIDTSAFEVFVGGAEFGCFFGNYKEKNGDAVPASMRNDEEVFTIPILYGVKVRFKNSELDFTESFEVYALTGEMGKLIAEEFHPNIPTTEGFNALVDLMKLHKTVREVWRYMPKSKRDETLKLYSKLKEITDVLYIASEQNYSKLGKKIGTSIVAGFSQVNPDIEALMKEYKLKFRPLTESDLPLDRHSMRCCLPEFPFWETKKYKEMRRGVYIFRNGSASLEDDEKAWPNLQDVPQAITPVEGAIITSYRWPLIKP